MKKIIFLKGPSQYEVHNFFLDELKLAFERLGKEVVLVDFTSENRADTFAKALSHSIDFILSYNALGIDMQVNQKSFFDSIGVKLFTILVDHPYHQIDRLANRVENLIVACVDKGHARFCNAFLGNKEAAFFLPHFGL